MASSAKLNLDGAVRGLMDRDEELCGLVIKDDNEVDEAERRVDQLGMEAIARFRPVASDLRLVLASMKVSTNLERISDHAVGIAKRARKMIAVPVLAEVTFAERLYTLASELLRDGVMSYADSNVDLGVSLGGRDKKLDKAYKRATSVLSERMAEANGEAESYLHLIFILRSLERIGDLAVNIGEDAVFMEAARDIRHGYGLDDDPD